MNRVLEFLEDWPATPAPPRPTSSIAPRLEQGVYELTRRVGGCEAFYAVDAKGEIAELRVVRPGESKDQHIAELAAIAEGRRMPDPAAAAPSWTDNDADDDDDDAGEDWKARAPRRNTQFARSKDLASRGVYAAPWLGRRGEVVLLAIDDLHRLVGRPFTIRHGTSWKVARNMMWDRLERADPSDV